METQAKVGVAAIALALAAGGVVYAQNQKKADATAHSVTASSADLPKLELSKESVDKVTKIELKNGDKPGVTLEKKGEDWVVTKPVEAKANAANVKTLLDNLKEIKVKETIDKTDAKYAAYELNDEKAVRVTAYEGAKKLVDMRFGKSGSRGQIARIGDQVGAYVTSGYSGYLYTRDASGWRDKSILKFEDSNATAVEIKNKNGVFSFSKNDDKWSATVSKLNKKGEMGEPKPLEKFDEAKIKDMLRAYKALAADDFGDDKSDAGFDAAETEGGVVKISLKDGAGDVIVRVGKVSKGTSRFAKKEGGDGTVFTIGSWSADWATADETKFQKGDDAKKPKHGDDDGHGHELEMPDMPDMPGME